LLRVDFSYRLPECERRLFPVAGLLPKRTLQSPDISGKRGPQTVESNEINILVKTHNKLG
jgi:hypothetical protein